MSKGKRDEEQKKIDEPMYIFMLHIIRILDYCHIIFIVKYEYIIHYHDMQRMYILED